MNTLLALPEVLPCGRHVWSGEGTGIGNGVLALRRGPARPTCQQWQRWLSCSVAAHPPARPQQPSDTAGGQPGAGESESIPLPQLQGPHCLGPPVALPAKLALPSAHGRLGGAEEEVPPGESGEKGAELNPECALQTCYSRSRSGCRLKRAF